MIFAIGLLILILPLGIDLSYQETVLSLRLVVGPFRWKLRGGTEMPERFRGIVRKIRNRRKKPKPPSQQPEAQAKPKSPKKRSISFSDIRTLLAIVLQTLSRLRRSVSVDTLRLSIVFAAQNPYDAILNYGTANAVSASLSPLMHQIFKIRREEVRLDVDVSSEISRMDAEFQITIQLWEILWIGFAAGWGILRWLRQRKKEQRAAVRPEGQKG